MNPIQEFLRHRRALVAPLAAAVLLIALPACAQSHGGDDMGKMDDMSNGSEVVAKVNGAEISMSDLETKAEDALEQVDMQLLQCQRQAEQSRYDALNAQLEDLVHERLVAAEAEKAGQTPEEYLAAQLNVEPVTDADVAAFFEENKARIGNRTLEQIGPQIRQYLENTRQAEAENSFYSNLESKYDVAYLLEPPRADVEATGPAKGPEDAPVTIVEFSDFECPFCSRVVPTLEQVQENYGDKVRLVFRQFPLSIHPHAPKAAEASLCARDQGKFWEMHDHMFANQKALSVDDLKAAAATLGLDTDQFNQCLDSGKYESEVQADLQAGVAAGVSGTPAMFINGQLVSGAVPYEQIASVIDAELKRKGMDGGDSGSSAE